jgi:hypothetical protein
MQNDQRNWKNFLRMSLQLTSLNPEIQTQSDKESEEYERRNAICGEKDNGKQINEKRRASKKRNQLNPAKLRGYKLKKKNENEE